MTREKAIKVFESMKSEESHNALIDLCNMAIDALQFTEHFDILKEYESLQEVVMCKDCCHTDECHKSVHYTRNEPNSVTIGYLPIEWCSRGERREE